jgi:NAD(P)-dependent dehydrogenase (short-subunit alcohol dehydrogenase family)
MMESKNRVAVATGGSWSIGRGISLELAGRGCQVVVNYSTSADVAYQRTR